MKKSFFRRKLNGGPKLSFLCLCLLLDTLGFLSSMFFFTSLVVSRNYILFFDYTIFLKSQIHYNKCEF